jgi:TonB family protein
MPEPAEDIDAVTRQADAVLASLHESEFGGIGQDSAATRAAAIVDDHHEPTTEQLAEEGPHIGGTYTEAPELTNAEQVKRLLSRDYPAALRDGGVGGRVLLWLLIDEEGKLRRCLLKASSGHAALDRVAMKEAAVMRFRPAWNYDRHVPLWIVLPITFVVDEG